MGRHAIYLTIEDKREAQRVASLKYSQQKAKKNPKPPIEPKISYSYTKEYHQERYQRKKAERLLAIACSSLSLLDKDSDSQSLD